MLAHPIFFPQEPMYLEGLWPFKYSCCVGLFVLCHTLAMCCLFQLMSWEVLVQAVLDERTQRGQAHHISDL